MRTGKSCTQQTTCTQQVVVFEVLRSCAINGVKWVDSEVGHDDYLARKQNIMRSIVRLMYLQNIAFLF